MDCEKKGEDDNKRPQFGNRFLTSEDNVYKHNAWDDVQWSEEQLQMAKELVERNSCDKISADRRQHYEREAHSYWDKFYDIHQNRFFKDRNWLFSELPELATLREQGPKSLLEVGCGAGNTVYPILQTVDNPHFRLFCCDFSDKAVELVRTNPEFDPERCIPFRCDVANLDDWQASPLKESSLDMILLIFTMSALDVHSMADAVSNMVRYLKPGGMIFFRDYGRYDLAQLRFKNGKCIDNNLYVRGDGTRCYFFQSDFVSELFVGAGLTERDLIVDRRLQVNRGKQLKMYRVWIQGKYILEK